ncbi:MAG TPA: CPBP family intramembrane metalloprotease [Methanocorpusculum sp.]|nr:CPBP family intramembrane metalloprotease [Methanocorpusculum sp.]
METGSSFIVTSLLLSDVIVLAAGGIIYHTLTKGKKIENPLKVLRVKDWCLILLFSIGLSFLIDCMLAVVTQIWPEMMDSYNELLAPLFSDFSLLTIPAVGLIGPIAEELVFRGLTFKFARMFTRKFWLANIIQAAMFGIAHMNPVQGIYTFIFGLGMGYLYKKYNSLYAPILAHIISNTLSLTVFLIFGDLTLPEGESAGTALLGLLILIGAVSFVPLSIWFIKKDKRIHEREGLFFRNYEREYLPKPAAAVSQRKTTSSENSLQLQNPDCCFNQTNMQMGLLQTVCSGCRYICQYNQTYFSESSEKKNLLSDAGTDKHWNRYSIRRRYR